MLSLIVDSRSQYKTFNIFLNNVHQRISNYLLLTIQQKKNTNKYNVLRI